MTRYIGKEMSRVDGIAKVTGKAKYAAEFKVPNLAYGFIVLGSIAKGTIKAIDTTRETRVIAYTAMAPADELFTNAMFAAVIQKPATPDVVLAAVRNLAEA